MGKKNRPKSWFAVARGRRVGLFSSWPEAQESVAGFPRATFKGFETKAEAIDYLRAHGLTVDDTGVVLSAGAAAGGGGGASNAAVPAAATAPQPQHPQNQRKVYAVARGYPPAPGIFERPWHEVSRMVSGFRGARFKAFPSSAAAQAWLDEQQEALGGGGGASSGGGGGAASSGEQPPPPKRARTGENSSDGGSGSGGGSGGALPSPAEVQEQLLAQQRRRAAAAALAAPTEEETEKPQQQQKQEPANQSTNPPPLRVRLEFDGGTRGNPVGFSGYGYALYDRDRTDGSNKPLKLFFGCRSLAQGTTNNEAEYWGLIAGLARARQLGAADVLAVGDSQLVVRQTTGQYAVRDPKLVPLAAKAREHASALANFSIESAPRAENRAADALANLAMDVDAAIVRTVPALVRRGAPQDEVARALGRAMALGPEDVNDLANAPDFAARAAEMVARVMDDAPVGQVARAMRQLWYGGSGGGSGVGAGGGGGGYRGGGGGAGGGGDEGGGAGAVGGGARASAGGGAGANGGAPPPSSGADEASGGGKGGGGPSAAAAPPPAGATAAAFSCGPRWRPAPSLPAAADLIPLQPPQRPPLLVGRPGGRMLAAGRPSAATAARRGLKVGGGRVRLC